MESLGAKPAASDGGACYRVAEGILNGWYQKVHVLTVDPSSGTVTVRPVLSFDQLFGYETLKFMDARLDALASGFTGKTLSRFLTDMGLLEAALLDGGASSEIIVGHEIRNILSAGRERKLPSGFMLVKK